MLKGLVSNPRCSFGIAGGRRMGKSTLLRRLETELNAKKTSLHSSGLLVIPIYVDGLSLPRPLSASDIWTYLFRELQRVSKELSQDNFLLDFDLFKEKIGPILKKHPRIIVMFDEIEPILVHDDWANAFLSHWRALLSNTPNISEHFTAVFAGAREISALRRDVGSPLMDILEWRSLRNLSFEAASCLMEEPSNYTWPDSFKKRTFQETGGQPMLIQYLMQQVYRVVSASEVQLSPETLLGQATKKFMSQRHWQFSEWWDRYCTPIAQRIYVRLPEDGSTLPLRSLIKEFGNQTHDALDILQHIGIAQAEDDGFAFRFSGEMFQHWYQLYGSIADAPVHDREIYDKLAGIAPEFADKYLSAWKIYQTDLQNYSGASGEIRDTFTQVLHKLAPDKLVMAQPNFALEKDQKTPTRRQRIRYIMQQRYSKAKRSNAMAEEIDSDIDILETQLTKVVTKAYGDASGMTHTTATREKVYPLLKRFDNILAQLVCL
jgi:hypothetical protein